MLSVDSNCSAEFSSSSIEELAEFSDKKEVEEHVAKYACVTAPEPGRSDGSAGPSNIKGKRVCVGPHKEEERGCDQIDLQQQKRDEGYDSEEDFDPDWEEDLNMVLDKTEWINRWFHPPATAIDIDEELRKHISQLSSVCGEKRFTIRVGGYCGEDKKPGQKPGYGAIICDFRCKPLIAESEVLPETSHVSPFYHELQGVDLGLKLAIKYRVPKFWFCCTSVAVAVAAFLHDCLFYNERCTCEENSESKLKECEGCLKSKMPSAQREYFADLLPVIKDIVNNVSTLEGVLGLSYCHFEVTAYCWDDNKLGSCLAELGESKTMFPHDIKQNTELTNLLYADAAELYRRFVESP